METATNYGECRCCLAKGNHKYLSKEYYCNGTREIYADLFIECFNLFLSTDTRLSSFICQSCIKHLKDANSFRTSVMNAEAEMLRTLSGDDANETVFVNGNTEVVKDELKHDVKVEWTSMPTDEETYDCTLADMSVEDPVIVCGEEKLLARFPHDSIPPLPTRAELASLCPHFVKRLDELKGQVIKAKMVQELLNSPKSRTRIRKHKRLKNEITEKEFNSNIDVSTWAKTPLSEKMAHVQNISTLLGNSNMTAFMTKFKNGYPCFYCKSIFENFDTLREHQKEHSKDNIEKFILKKYRKGRPDSLVVYVDVTDLKCTLCGVDISTLNDLKSHLTKFHKKVLHSNYTDRVIPFKISDKYLCQVCSFNFETFGALERHMNTHFRNYVCEECGAGFIAKHRLKVHMYNIHSSQEHSDGQFPCNICKKTFTTHRRFKIHHDLIHKMSKKLRCPKCPARFSYYYVRQKHLLDAHGETPVIYKCNVCEKEFKRRYPLSIHIKKEHLSQGDFNCELCSQTCFSSNELKAHLMKRHWGKAEGKSIATT